jgi:predicted transcriptional regulator with HTH domain
MVKKLTRKKVVELSEWQKRVLFYINKFGSSQISDISHVFGSDYGFGSYGKGRVTAKWWGRYLGKLHEMGMLKVSHYNFGSCSVDEYSITKKGKTVVKKYQDSIAEYIASAL